MTTTPNFKESIDTQVNSLIERYAKELVGQYSYQVSKQVNERLETVIERLIRNTIDKIEFPDSSIPISSINWTGFNISTDQIQDYKKLNGLEDFSKNTELTILDGVVVIENQVITKTVIADDITVNGNLILNDLAFNGLADRIVNLVPRPQITEQKSYDEDIQRLDKKIDSIKPYQFKQLEVSGESFLSNVLYTTPGNKRVGINTMEPSDALTVWDNEVEVVIGKHQSQQGYIGTRRRQDINIGANNKVGLTIKSDGTVEINKLNLLGRTISESDNVPGFAAKTGDIVLNSKPKPGAFIGWICLDGLKWSGFGKIE
jgi:hypothetical protein